MTLFAGLIGFWLGLWVAAVIATRDLDVANKEVDRLKRRERFLEALCQEAYDHMQSPPPDRVIASEAMRLADLKGIDRVLSPTENAAFERWVGLR